MIKNKYNCIGLILLVISLISLASAWPYELYANGTIIDLNSSNNLTTTLAVTYTNVTYYTNYTTTNHTDYTYNNYTTGEVFANRSYFYNSTNLTTIINTYVLNVSNSSMYYNSTDADTKFLTINDFNTYKTIADAADTSNGHGFMWVMIIVSLLTSIICAVALFKAMAPEKV